MSTVEASLQLPWLPKRGDWSELLKEARNLASANSFVIFHKLAMSRMNFIRAGNLDKAVERFREEHSAPPWPGPRLAVLGSSTLHHAAGDPPWCPQAWAASRDLQR